jgi:hypothetical protein
MSADGNSVSGDGWQMAWGKALNSIPGIDGPEQAALTRTLQPNQQPNSNVTRNMAAFLLLLMGAGNSGSAEDVSYRLGTLKSELAEAEHACTSHHSTSPYAERDPGGYCGKAEDLRDKLDDINSALAEEIRQLEEARKTLAPECKTGNKQSCQKLEQVNKRLERDNTIFN